MKEILIIEDDIVMQFLLRNLFTDAGYKVNSIMDGTDLIDHKAIESADLIILDMMIPHVYDGSDLIKLYKGHESPIIVISSIDKEDGLYFSKKIDAQAFFNKPFESEDLFKKVKLLLETHKKTEIINS
jgi:two-component system OmpR family response regulator/two-component system response regulator CpxR